MFSVLLDPFYICPPNFKFLCHLEVLTTKMHYILVVRYLNSIMVAFHIIISPNCHLKYREIVYCKNITCNQLVSYVLHERGKHWGSTSREILKNWFYMLMWHVLFILYVCCSLLILRCVLMEQLYVHQCSMNNYHKTHIHTQHQCIMRNYHKHIFTYSTSIISLVHFSKPT